MTAIGRRDGEALVSYSLETTIDVEVGWGGRGGLMDIVEIRYRIVVRYVWCVPARGVWVPKKKRISWIFGHKKGNGYKI